MKKWTWQLIFGLVLGIVLRLIFPGHRAAGFAVTGGVSLAGATLGTGIARVLLPPDVVRRSGFLLAGMGALAALLFESVVEG